MLRSSKIPSMEDTLNAEISQVISRMNQNDHVVSGPRIEHKLHDGSILSFIRGKVGGPPLSPEYNNPARHLTHSLNDGSERRVCVLGSSECMIDLFMSEEKVYFATRTDTDNYDEYNWGRCAQRITVWKYEDGEFQHVSEFKGLVKSFCLSPDGQVLAYASPKIHSIIRFYSTATKKLINLWSCLREGEYEISEDESNVFNSISLAKINGEYVVAYLRNTVTPQPSFPGYFNIVRNTGIEIRMIDNTFGFGFLLAEINHPDTVKVEFFDGGRMLRYYERKSGLPLMCFEKNITFSTAADTASTCET